MNQKRLIWQLYPSYLAVTVTAVLVVTAYSSHCLRDVHRNQVREELNDLASFAVDEARLALAGEDTDKLAALCRQIGGRGNGKIRLTVIAPSGEVLGDSDRDPDAMENHAGRYEIREALRTGRGSSIRFSRTLGAETMYVALAVKEQGVPVGVIRVAAPMTEIDSALRGIYVNMLWAGLIIAAGAAVLSLLISRRLSQPIVAIERVAQRFAAGELDLRVPMPDSAELATLASSLNKMATQLGERITTITEQRNELDAVLASMVEGVFAVDNKGRIMSVNPAAARLLGLDPARAQGRPLEEVVRHADLQEFVRQTLAGVQADEADFTLPGDGGRSFRLHGAGLTDARGRRSGAVIVLNDMTRLRRLEAVRRDFVANVSHELKTPVTSIQGFVEALVDGGVQDPAQIERYLGIIARHAARLNAIIDDLLTLSRLAEAGPHRSLNFAVCPIKPVLTEAIDLAGVRADEKDITIDLTCDDDLEARIDPPLLEQAVINLVDNAIKYSPQGSRIRVEASLVPRRSSLRGDTAEPGADRPSLVFRPRQGPGDEQPAANDEPRVAIAVHDEGCGIAPEHLPRLFERFYVVDRSRSRKLGGTGLGLAIVKHIAQAHGGRVTVESSPGKGSTFTIYLPVSATKDAEA